MREGGRGGSKNEKTKKRAGPNEEDQVIKEKERREGKETGRRGGRK